MSPYLPSDGASYTPPVLPRVGKHPGGRSYFTNDASGLVAYLEGQGWRRYPPKTGSEQCRLWRSDALILVYLSGSIAIGGKRPEIGYMALGELLETPAGEQLMLWPEGSAV
jgi:hypothetical protein